MDVIFSTGANDVYFSKSDFDKISFSKSNKYSYYKFDQTIYGPSQSSFLGSKSITRNGDVILSNAGNNCYVYTGNYDSSYKLKQIISGKSNTYLLDFTLSNDNSVIIVGYEVSFNSGYIDIYTGNKNNGWNLQQNISGGIIFSKFGEAIAINSNKTVIMVGDSYDNNSSGIVSIYTGDINNQYILKQKIYGSGKQYGNQFGKFITANLDSSEVAISAITENNGTGIIHIYTGNSADGWNFKQYITGDYNGSFNFGGPTKLNQNGDTFIVGEQYDSSDRGSVLIYTKNNSGYWTFNQKIIGITINSEYGTSIDFNENVSKIIIGGPKTDKNVFNRDAGAIMILEKNNNTFLLKQAITGNSAYDYFANSVALNFDEKILVIGIPNSDYSGNNAGAISIYKYIDEYS